jgi:formate dehydrogenase iron-sulfur subunit
MMADKAILFDATLCTACRGIPTTENGVDSSNWGSYENPRDLSPRTWLKIGFKEVERRGGIAWLFARRSCMHCTDAGCIEVCPNGSVYHHEMGFVAYNRDTCTGCGYCADACPFDVPRFTQNTLTGSAKMDKCTMCTSPGLDRLREGQEPACVKTCPPGALAWGNRAELVADGGQRVAALKANGNGQARLYGATELGGLHVMYLLDDTPAAYGLPEDPRVPGISGFWKGVLQPLGSVVGIVALVGLGLNYYVARRAQLANAKDKED